MNKNEIHILLVDDDRQNSLLLKRFLELEGYSVTYASDGAAAWEMYNRQHPDLILLDVNMPVMNLHRKSVKRIVRYSCFS